MPRDFPFSELGVEDLRRALLPVSPGSDVDPRRLALQLSTQDTAVSEEQARLALDLYMDLARAPPYVTYTSRGTHVVRFPDDWRMNDRWLRHYVGSPRNEARLLAEHIDSVLPFLLSDDDWLPGAAIAHRLRERYVPHMRERTATTYLERSTTAEPSQFLVRTMNRYSLNLRYYIRNAPLFGLYG